MEEQTHQADGLQFDYKQTEEAHSIIKVVGVGGGGGNAVQHMYSEGNIQDVTYLIINTDEQALRHNSVPNKLAIAQLGAGAQPEVARQYAEDHADEIRTALNDGTRMAFITAGMGGGTGTGAGPVVARIAQELDILTVGIVTIPFSFEGTDKIQMALDGVDEMRKHVDALLVVNNDRLIDIYPDLNFRNAMGKADDTLAFAAKSISDIINIPGYINVDFADVTTTLKGSGVALISTGRASGEKRVTRAIQEAIKSPLLLDNDISHAKHLLFELCYSASNPTEMREIGELNAFIKTINPAIKVIWGAMEDDTLGEDVKIILLASGFEFDGGNVVPQTEKTPEQIAAEAEAQERARLLQMQQEAERAAREEAERQAREEAERAAREQAEREQKERQRQELLRQIAALQSQLDGMGAGVVSTPTADDATAAAEPSPAEAPQAQPEVTPAPAAEAQPVVEPVAAEPVATHDATPTAPTAQPEVQPETAEGTTATAEPAEPAPTPIAPATSTLDGIERIRRYYGDQVADLTRMDQVRQNYCVLDNEDLTNEDLIGLMEKLPAYNRTAEDLSRIRAVRQSQPSSPSTPAADGTIRFD